MKTIQYDVGFVMEFGSNHQTTLEPDIIEKLLLLKKTYANLQINDENPINLKKKDSKWRKNAQTSNTSFKKDCIKEIYLQLNKLSDSNIETISFQINSIINGEIQEKQILVEKLIDRLFQNARIQINFCHLYANLFSNLIHKNKDLYFEKIQGKIKDEFKKIENMQIETENYSEYCDSIQIKDNYIGCYQFCIELYTYNVLTINNIVQIVNNIIQDLKKQQEIYRIEIIIESICRIVKTIKKSKRIKDNELLMIISLLKNGYNENKTKLNPRSRFLFEDALVIE